MSSSPSRLPTMSSSPSRLSTMSSSPSRLPTMSSSPSRLPTMSSSPSRLPTMSSSPSRLSTMSLPPYQLSTTSSSPSRLSTTSLPPSRLSTTSLSPSRLSTGSLIQPVTMNNNKIKIIPIQYEGSNKIGDFTWMINRKEYSDALFIFNDNQEQFLDFARYINDNNQKYLVNACKPGQGNDKIRNYQCLNPPRAAGIPIGSQLKGSYSNLKVAKPYIDSSLNFIKDLLKTGIYKRIFYISDKDNYLLKVDAFEPSYEIKKYITDNIYKLTK